jgi:23S rRNA (cytosine1962-C5)-methyltransferase
VFDGALEPADLGAAEPGIAELRDHSGHFVATGTVNPRSAIAMRMFRFTPGPLDHAFFTGAFQRARHLRDAFIPQSETTGYRLVHGEGDGLPGLVVDNYAGHLTVQVGTPGLDQLADVWADALQSVFAPHSIRVRTDQGLANREHFHVEARMLRGTPPDEIEFSENGVPFVVNPAGGQKTGTFFDQRENRRTVASLSRGKRVLDAFCYHAGFALTALAFGAREAVAIDSSADALDGARRNAIRSGVENRLETVRADVHEFLRSPGEPFDIVVVDPPALAKRAQHTDRAARAYKDLFLHGIRSVCPGGAAMLCSCSSAIRRDLFDMIVGAAVQDSGRTARIVSKTGAGADHPVSAFHPEGEYLKASLLIVD